MGVEFRLGMFEVLIQHSRQSKEYVEVKKRKRYIFETQESSVRGA